MFAETPRRATFKEQKGGQANKTGVGEELALCAGSIPGRAFAAERGFQLSRAMSEKDAIVAFWVSTSHCQTIVNRVPQCFGVSGLLLLWILLGIFFLSLASRYPRLGAFHMSTESCLQWGLKSQRLEILQTLHKNERTAHKLRLFIDYFHKCPSHLAHQ